MTATHNFFFCVAFFSSQRTKKEGLFVSLACPVDTMLMLDGAIARIAQLVTLQMQKTFQPDFTSIVLPVRKGNILRQMDFLFALIARRVVGTTRPEWQKNV